MKTVLVTGGAGFIGGNFVLRRLRDEQLNIINLDALTYAGNLDTLQPVADNPRHHFVHGDINDQQLVTRLLNTHQPEAVVNFAAESHVDRSIDEPDLFIKTNVNGTQNLLKCSLDYWHSLDRKARQSFCFLHVSTDEVYGSLGPEGAFTEQSPYAPNSPYAASKAAADHLVRAYHHTYGLPTLTTNCSNNYGPYQFPEKLIPLMILNALEGKALPVYGDGQQVRDWLFVDDHCDALWRALQDGRIGQVYNIGGDSERANIDVVNEICAILDRKQARKDGGSYTEQLEFVTDRPGHDRRYAIDCNKLKSELGWQPKIGFDQGLEQTIDWYISHPEWVGRVKDGSYRGERLGLGVRTG